ncbi:MAG: DUF4465 domain-containing protein [Bacteroidia bacterium]|nr:MAG: DUF4465 domain-containing protein [Bacteroidia bacterium]
MKKLSLLLLLSTFIFCACSDDDEVNVVAGFESQLSETESEYSSTTGTKYDDIYFHTTFKDEQELLEFDHYYSSWGFGGGFIYTNKTDITTPGYTNNSAITGTGKYGKVYLTSYYNSFTPSKIVNLNPDLYKFKGMWVTNSTYAYLSIKDGDSMAKKFVAGDWFKLTITGYSSSKAEIGRINFYLADFRDGKSININTWQWVDLSSLNNASYIEFSMSSTKNNTWGMLTPSYFCLDGITLAQK